MRDKRRVGVQALQRANMNETGRLPAFSMFHLGMHMRLTQTVEQPNAVVDTDGDVVGIDFDERERKRHTDAAQHTGDAVVMLEYFPTVYLKLRDVNTEFLRPSACPVHAEEGAQRACCECNFHPGVLAVAPMTSRPWNLNVEVAGVSFQAKIVRTQLPITTMKAATLHGLQGATTDPGLIMHWIFPRRLSTTMRWLATYVALSRVRALSKLRSVGLTKAIRAIIEEGPPETLPRKFQDLFAEREQATAAAAVAAVVKLGWV